MNYTEKYHLPQWEETDRIMRTDFNQMCADIESGIGKAEGKADAAYGPGRLPYVVGSYVGTGETTTITLGFRPSFVIISGMRTEASNMSSSNYVRYFGATGGHALHPKVEFTDTGFKVYDHNSGYGAYPDLTSMGRDFDYIAFR